MFIWLKSSKYAVRNKNVDISNGNSNFEKNRTFTYDNGANVWQPGNIRQIPDRTTCDKNRYECTRWQIVGQWGDDCLQCNRLPESRISYIQDNKVNETRWTYDAYGNITSELSAPYDVATFLGTTFTYDAEGRNLASSTNALGQTTTYANYDKFGHAGTVTDFKHRSTSYQYDAWGQLISTQHPDGTKEEVKTDWGGQGLIGQQLEEVEEEFQINISLRIQLIKTFIKTFFMKRKNGTGVIMNLLQWLYPYYMMMRVAMELLMIS